jgi:hypothetical protein
VQGWLRPELLHSAFNLLHSLCKGGLRVGGLSSFIIQPSAFPGRALFGFSRFRVRCSRFKVQGSPLDVGCSMLDVFSLSSFPPGPWSVVSSRWSTVRRPPISAFLPRRLVSPKSDEGGSRTQAGAFQRFSFSPSNFCFLLSPKRRFGALRPQAEPPFLQKLRSDPDMTRTAPVPTPGLNPFPGTSSFRIRAECAILGRR